jgi:hypothetical protein
VFAGLVHPDQPADPLSKYYSSTSRYSIFLLQNQPISAKFQTSERADSMFSFCTHVLLFLPGHTAFVLARHVSACNMSSDNFLCFCLARATAVSIILMMSNMRVALSYDTSF